MHPEEPERDYGGREAGCHRPLEHRAVPAPGGEHTGALEGAPFEIIGRVAFDRSRGDEVTHRVHGDSFEDALLEFPWRSVGQGSRAETADGVLDRVSFLGARGAVVEVARYLGSFPTRELPGDVGRNLLPDPIAAHACSSTPGRSRSTVPGRSRSTSTVPGRSRSTSSIPRAVSAALSFFSPA